MRARSFSSSILALALLLTMSSSLPAGAIAQALGAGWDKAIGKIVKAHEKANAKLQEAQPLKTMCGKVKAVRPGGAGGCNKCR